MKTVTTLNPETILADLQNSGLQHDGHIVEHVCTLLESDNDEDKDETAFFYKLMTDDLMSILTDPAVSSKLPEYAQPAMGKYLIKLSRFFNDISDPACLKAFALYESK